MVDADPFQRFSPARFFYKGLIPVTVIGNIFIEGADFWFEVRDDDEDMKWAKVDVYGGDLNDPIDELLKIEPFFTKQVLPPGGGITGKLELNISLETLSEEFRDLSFIFELEDEQLGTYSVAYAVNVENPPKGIAGYCEMEDGANPSGVEVRSYPVEEEPEEVGQRDWDQTLGNNYTSVVTDSQGNFEFHELTNGRYLLVALKEGYFRSMMAVNVEHQLLTLGSPLVLYPKEGGDTFVIDFFDLDDFAWSLSRKEGSYQWAQKEVSPNLEYLTFGANRAERNYYSLALLKRAFPVDLAENDLEITIRVKMENLHPDSYQSLNLIVNPPEDLNASFWVDMLPGSFTYPDSSFLNSEERNIIFTFGRNQDRNERYGYTRSVSGEMTLQGPGNIESPDYSDDWTDIVIRLSKESVGLIAIANDELLKTVTFSPSENDFSNIQSIAIGFGDQGLSKITIDRVMVRNIEPAPDVNPSEMVFV
ncbi:MAG TPA: carboxypeptidase-like regulatory domain-containing protein, partial [Thermotogota bacterium]|nr:carboxypeptidase-like regulatory domain-containing protein [Thermotogota bacterium]